jgi:hypothetical protein
VTSIRTSAGQGMDASFVCPRVSSMQFDVQGLRLSSFAARSVEPAEPCEQDEQALVTLVVTDVEGSTALWEGVPEAMDGALEVHDTCLRVLMMRHGGHEVATEGDSFTVAFHRPVDALQWGLDVQEVGGARRLWHLWRSWQDSAACALRWCPHTSTLLQACGGARKRTSPRQCQSRARCSPPSSGYSDCRAAAHGCPVVIKPRRRRHALQCSSSMTLLPLPWLPFNASA